MFTGQVCVMSSHEYSTIWIDLNPTCLINMSKIHNPNTTCLLNKSTRYDTFNPFN